MMIIPIIAAILGALLLMRLGVFWQTLGVVLIGGVFFLGGVIWFILSIIVIIVVLAAI